MTRHRAPRLSAAFGALFVLGTCACDEVVDDHDRDDEHNGRGAAVVAAERDPRRDA